MERTGPKGLSLFMAHANEPSDPRVDHNYPLERLCQQAMSRTSARKYHVVSS
jgi:hypothetical protein